MWALVIVFLIALAFRRIGTWRPFVAQAPALLMTIGVLGTFIGIVIGLLDFDPNALDASVGKLLEGLKTAFMTSVAGMALGILYRILAATGWLTPKDPAQQQDSDVTASDLLAALNAQTEQMQLLRQDQRERLNALHAAVAGQEETNLAGQMKLLRADMNDRDRQDRLDREEFSGKLWRRLEEFSDQLSRSATEQIIEALRKVIADFNAKITEQFGDNFKALDASVQKLVTWQEQNRAEMARLQTLYSRSVEAIAAIEGAMTRIVESSAVIPGHMQALEDCVKTARLQIAELERHLQAFAELRDRAVEALPETRRHIGEMTGGIADSVAHMTNHQRAMLDMLAKAGERVQQDVAAVQERVAESVASMAGRMEKSIDETLGKQEKAARDAAAGMQQATDTALTAFTESGKSVRQEVAAVQKTVSDRIDTMANRIEVTIEKTRNAQEQSTNHAADGLRQATEQMAQKFNQHMQQALTRTEEGVNAQMGALDKALETELGNAMRQMGKGLGQISQKFTEDYKELTAQMTEVVQHGSLHRGPR